MNGPDNKVCSGVPVVDTIPEHDVVQTCDTSQRGSGGKTEPEIPWLLSVSAVYANLLLKG